MSVASSASAGNTPPGDPIAGASPRAMPMGVNAAEGSKGCGVGSGLGTMLGALSFALLLRLRRRTLSA
jgi:hypothetical protein